MQTQQEKRERLRENIGPIKRVKDVCLKTNGTSHIISLKSYDQTAHFHQIQSGTSSYRQCREMHSITLTACSYPDNYSQTVNLR